ncbi:MAG: hypothetical protein KZQ64_04405 [gamma proteobacterium symbiont of Bathyaustriella thionipta]|nr:hypothetical protein [gamma proteobacterium symbiont of Bathyaustriella thionipta]MCU7948673.1 hypothetical protein [gamma proteobacterium symbiont of Bathyaustriella thionipta]MCU7952621.1 hypothetical protein [gamma proteobacterium symbiont of Bathyaustriella thionipta]MCU7955118.1 hypothetical protein [gamma proteobacterium symbiont of Bathyaustriella thionipta]MCU7968267.1 hypothetical protein [gamma proteobacterium symbiont of Bathyaustriella thionipta]
MMTGLFILGVVILNLIADPLDIYRVVKVDGFNSYKTTYGSYTRLAKPVQIERNQYQRIALGSSRTEIGIPAYGTAWDEKGESGFNAALNGATIDTLAAMLYHSTQVAPVKSVVISTDFFMFNGYSKQKYSYPELLYKSDDWLDGLVRYLDGSMLTLFSSSITKASIRTLRKQKEMDNKYHEWGQQNNQREIKKNAALGYQARFKHFENGSVRNSWTPCRDNRFRYEDAHGHNTLRVLEEMLRWAASHDVEVHLFISPVHARLLETLDANGFWLSFEQWKRDLTLLVEQINKEAGAKIELWDFTGYNRYTTESLPTDSSYMKWYLDSSHYTDTVGKIILNTLFSKQQVSDGFGVKLTNGIIDEHLQSIRQTKIAYRAENREQFNEIKSRTKKYLVERQKRGKRCQ